MAFNLDDYEQVDVRLAKFWEANPGGRVVTVLVDHADGHYIVRAEVFRSEDGLPSASGLAEESKSDRGVNATSALENCETSAIGRALANLGYAAKGKRPSREEMSKTSPAAGPQRGVATNPDERPSEDRTGAGDTSSEGTAAVLGEGAVEPSGGKEPGEVVQSSLSASPGSPTFPVDPIDCTHHYATGVPSKVKVGGKEICRLCGMDWIAVVEGTTADLGAA